MNNRKDAKTIYARSSDIKARTYLQYRKDMKKKAIAELEIRPWLEQLLQKKFKNPKIRVEKYGGDRFIWFLRKGGITREPDFVVTIPKQERKFFEFQYAEQADTSFFDFKVSKITPRSKKAKEKIKKTQFLYVIKSLSKYALLSPEWIYKHGEKGFVSAWRSYAYRVPKNDLLKVLKKGKSLEEVCRAIDMKTTILDFQHKAIEIEEEKLSKLLQGVIDENRIVKIMPKTLDGFYKVCFVLDHIDKIPENANLWLIYLLSFINEKLNSYDLFRIFYSLDFLYSKIELRDNEMDSIIKAIKKSQSILRLWQTKEGIYKSSKRLAPIDETRYCLFIINVLEDIVQDLIYYYGDKVKDRLHPITKIYQTVENIERLYQFIEECDG